MQLTIGDGARLYNVEEGGQCNVYDFIVNDWEGDMEISNVVTYNGTWSVTDDLSNLDFVYQFDLSGFELVGGLILQVKKEIDENDMLYKTLSENGFTLNVEEKDTLAMLLDKETGDMAFINRTNAYLMALLLETGQLSDEAAAARAATRADAITRATGGSTIEERIKNLIESNEKIILQQVGNKKIDNSNYMGLYFQGLNPRICDMSILGAGGAPTAYLPEDFDEDILKNHKRQYLSIKELWNLGVRYFDLGTIYVPEKGSTDFCFYDEDMEVRYPNITPKQVFEDLSQLLNEHPTETAIIMLDQAPNLDNKQMQEVALGIYNQLNEVFGADRLAMNYGPNLRLNDCRGKLIVMNNYEAPLSETKMGVCMRDLWIKAVITGEIDFPDNGSAMGIVQANTFVGISSIDEKISQMRTTLEFADRSAKSIEPTWVINHVCGREGFPGMVMTYLLNASSMNESFTYILMDRNHSKTGIVVADFIGINHEHEDALITINPNGVNFIAPIIGTNYYASKNHLISLDEGDVVK